MCSSMPRSTQMQDLKEITEEHLYETFRKQVVCGNTHWWYCLNFTIHSLFQLEQGTAFPAGRAARLVPSPTTTYPHLTRFF